MFPNIKTSKANKEKVAVLTRKLNLGTENIIARIAFTHSLSQDIRLNPEDISDSGGKEYAKEVLFGNYSDYYLGLIAVHYNIHISDKSLPKLVKLHIDHGLELLYEDFDQNAHLDGFEYIVNKIANGIDSMKYLKDLILIENTPNQAFK